MKTIDWFKTSSVFSNKYQAAWAWAGCILLAGCLALTIYFSL
tara:strand:+ start:6264 stop:6389 length:126 start_codon:yes stop_codon:yes gene_type:complete